MGLWLHSGSTPTQARKTSSQTRSMQVTFNFQNCVFFQRAGLFLRGDTEEDKKTRQGAFIKTRAVPGFPGRAVIVWARMTKTGTGSNNSEALAITAPFSSVCTRKATINSLLTTGHFTPGRFLFAGYFF